MERPNANQKKNPKKAKSMKKPLKIVYISNPVKFFTSASKFRALVQGLTGRDSDPADVEKFLVAYNADDFSREAEPEAEASAEGGIDDSSAGSRLPPDGDPNHEGLPISLTSHQFDIFDDIFPPEMLQDDAFKNLGPFEILSNKIKWKTMGPESASSALADANGSKSSNATCMDN